MNRRAFLQTTVGSALARGASPSRKPNILILMTDQQFADAMSCRIGNRYINTPNMDSLVASGTGTAYASSQILLGHASIRTSRAIIPHCIRKVNDMYTENVDEWSQVCYNCILN